MQISTNVFSKKCGSKLIFFNECFWRNFWMFFEIENWLMSGSCHLDRALNDKFSVECLFWFFQPTWNSNLKVVQITTKDLFWVNAPLQYLEYTPNCKTLSQLKKITITKIWHSTPVSTFDARSKWHEPDNQSSFRDYTTFISSINGNKHVFY